MTSQLFAAVHRRLVPFHYPGRDGRFLSALPPGELHRYNLLWLNRWQSWLGFAGLVALMATVVVFAGAPARAAVGLVGVVLPYALVFFHFENRLRRRLVERDHPQMCRTCGYDLRASSERCPECGAVASGREAGV